MKRNIERTKVSLPLLTSSQLKTRISSAKATLLKIAIFFNIILRRSEVTKWLQTKIKRHYVDKAFK